MAHAATLRPNASDYSVTALVSGDRLPRVAAALPPGTLVRRVTKVRDLAAGSPPETPLVVIDPLLFDVAGPELDRLLFKLVGIASVIVYTALNAIAMHRLQEARALIGVPLVIAGQDDAPDALRRALLNGRITTHRLTALRELRALAGPLPSAIDRAIAVLLTESRRLSVQSLAMLGHVSARTLERHLTVAGAPSAQWLMRMARALLARQLLCGSSLTVDAVAGQVGYAKPESLRMLLRWSFDSSPTALRQNCGQHQPRPATLSTRRRRIATAVES